jgi:uncharacterized repeat protein (TIGR01451 family)
MSGVKTNVSLTVMAILLALLARPTWAGSNFYSKVAVHILPHDDSRTCSHNLPEIDTCSDIITTYAGCGGVDVFPVFYEVEEYLGVEYGLTWPGSQSCVFTSCSDFQIGDITRPGDGISQVWTGCRPGPSAIPGFGWIDIVEPGQVCIVDHPETWAVKILDCASGIDEPFFICCAGVCGETGDDPCAHVVWPLNLDKTDDAGTECVRKGENINYTIAYDNPGWTQLEGVVATDFLAPETDYVSSSPPGTYEPGTHTVTWQIGGVPAGEAGSVSLTVMVRHDTQPGALMYNTCEITSDETPVVAAQETTEVCYDFAPLGLSKADWHGGTCVDPGDHFKYTLSYDNSGNSDDVHNVALTDRLPSNVVYVSSTGGTYDDGSHEVTWDLGTLSGGETGSVDITVRVKETALPGIMMGNHCSITSDEAGVTNASELTRVCEPPGPFHFAVAVHVEEHDDSRTCSGNMPEVTSCEDIITTSPARNVDVFPVFYEIEEYMGVEYSMWWDPATEYAAAFTSCSDLVIGDIQRPNDGVAHAWTSCQTGFAAIPGWIWLYADAPTRIYVMGFIPYGISVLNCNEELGIEGGCAGAGIYGAVGDDPCGGGPQDAEPTTWGKIKGMFR